jgi:hypothetical protein
MENSVDVVGGKNKWLDEAKECITGGVANKEKINMLLNRNNYVNAKTEILVQLLLKIHKNRMERPWAFRKENQQSVIIFANNKNYIHFLGNYLEELWVDDCDGKPFAQAVSRIDGDVTHTGR